MSIIVIEMGCESTPELIPWEQEKLEVEIERPMAKCDWPELAEIELDGRNIIYMEEEDFRKQAACQTVEKANYDVANNNADSIDEAIVAFNALIKKAEIHLQHAENELQRSIDKTNSTEWELFGYKVLFVLGVIVSVL